MTGSRPSHDLRDLDRQDRYRGTGACQRDRRRDTRAGRNDGGSRDGARADRRWRRTGTAAGDGGPAAPSAQAAATPSDIPPSPQTGPPVSEGNGAGDRRRYSPVVQRIAADRGIDLPRCPEPAVADGSASRTCWRSWSRHRSRHCTSRARTGLIRPRRRRPRRQPPASSSPHAPADRRAHEALAGHGRHVHDLDRGGHEPDRGRSAQLV